MLLSEIHFQASYRYSYLETRGLGCIEKLATELRALPPSQQKKSKVKGVVLTSIVRTASRNWRLTFLSDSLTVENCLFRSARVNLLPWALSFPPASALEAVFTHSCRSWMVELKLPAPDPAAVGGVIPLEASLVATSGAGEASPRSLPTT
jgi:hypothetical protein